MCNMTDTYQRAEQTTNEIIEMCVQKEITLKELQMLKTTLPIAIDKKINEYLCKQKLL